jgi:hypothetical protein
MLMSFSAIADRLGTSSEGVVIAQRSESRPVSRSISLTVT